MRKLILGSLVAVVAFTLVFAGGRILIEGSTTVLPLSQLAAEEYMDGNPGVNITVKGGGSGVGIASLIDGTCDIADASRPIKDKEIKKALENGVDPTAHVVAMDGIAVIVHPKNRVDGLSKDQIKAIYTGDISYWSEVGGSSKKIVVISRDSASGTFEIFNKLALDKERVRPDALLNASNRAVATAVSKTPGSIGYVGLGYVDNSVKAIKVNDIVCSEKTVASGKYHLARPLFMYTDGKPKGEVKKFVDFVLSKEGQQLAEQAGYVGLK
ncbi:MAG: PstS family phosphate ABC transporter substrate-binding protein [Elusimicrobiota bacterium]